MIDSLYCAMEACNGIRKHANSYTIKERNGFGYETTVIIITQHPGHARPNRF
jgi:hypothetical protein